MKAGSLLCLADRFEWEEIRLVQKRQTHQKKRRISRLAIVLPGCFSQCCRIANEKHSVIVLEQLGNAGREAARCLQWTRHDWREDKRWVKIAHSAGTRFAGQILADKHHDAQAAGPRVHRQQLPGSISDVFTTRIGLQQRVETKTLLLMQVHVVGLGPSVVSRVPPRDGSALPLH